MHAFYALHFDPNTYKDIFLWHFDSGCKKKLYFAFEVDEVTVGYICETIAKQIKNVFGN